MITSGASIRCPACGSPSSVVETRMAAPQQTRRRRRCDALTCGKKFTTVELIVDGNDKRNARGFVAVVSRRDLKQARELLANMLATDDEDEGDERDHHHEETRDTNQSEGVAITHPHPVALP